MRNLFQTPAIGILFAALTATTASSRTRGCGSAIDAARSRGASGSRSCQRPTTRVA